MRALRKKVDPLSDRSRTLNAEIADLEAKIKKLSDSLEKNKLQHPHLRSSAYPSGEHVDYGANALPPAFEEADAQAPKPPLDGLVHSSQHQELGIGNETDLSFWQRLQNPFRKPPAVNPKLINYLAAGSFQGLPPLRYEKRVARNRVLLLCLVFLILLLGILAMVYH